MEAMNELNEQHEMLKPIEVPNVSDVIYEQLFQHIVRGCFSPGDQLNLTQLEEQLGVSRTPLKMAIARLDNEGLITIHPRRGTFIAQLDETDLRECFEVRLALEMEALRGAFTEENEAHIRGIIDLLYEMDTLLNDRKTWLAEIPEYTNKDRKLHMSLVSLSNNRRMVQFYQQADLQGFIAIMGAHFEFDDVQFTKAEHNAIRHALEQRDDVLLRQAARRHIEKASLRTIARITRTKQEDAHG